jgi:hypothetical protein
VETAAKSAAERKRLRRIVDDIRKIHKAAKLRGFNIGEMIDRGRRF